MYGRYRHADLCGFAEADWAGLEAVQLVEDAVDWDIGDEVVHIVVLVGQAALLRHDGLRRREAVVRAADALAVADGQSCIQEHGFLFLVTWTN